MSDHTSKAKEIRDRAFIMRVPLRQIADALEYHRAYVSLVLGGKLKSKTALRRITEYLDLVEAGELQAA
jgi:hypothetical protein